MKRLAVLCSAIGLSFLGNATLSAQTIKSTDEEWIPVQSRGITFFVPAINFTAEQINESQYELSWNVQAGATSYKIERLSYDGSTPIPGAEIATHWEEVVTTTANNYELNHSLKDFDLNGHQTYRLNSCISAVCEPLAQLTYFLNADEVNSAIVQNFQVTKVTETTAANLNFKNQVKNKSSNTHPYAEGYGYSMITGHSPTPSLATSNNIKASKSDSQQTQRSLVNIETHEYLLTWEEVPTATHYVILRTVIKANSPTKTFISSTVNKENALTTSYLYQLISGEYDFKVVACSDSSPLLICGGKSKTRITSVPPNTAPDTSLQPRNVTYSDADAVVAYKERFKIKWFNPPIEGNSEMRLDHFEVYGELSGKIATVTARSGQSYEYDEVERNTGIRYGDGTTVPVLDPGKQYCYKVIPIYTVYNANPSTQAGEAAYPGPVQCITVDKVVFQAPDSLSIVSQIPNSESRTTYGVPVTWAPITTNPAPQNYLVEIQYPFVGSGAWRPVYYGSEPYTTLYLSDGNQAIRVSACDENDLCGNYRRIYFWNTNNFASDSLDKKPSCFNIEQSIVGDEQIQVNWCRPLAADIDEYEILDQAGNSLYSSKSQPFEIKPNGVFYGTVDSLFGPEEEHRCLTLWARYDDGTSESSVEKCLETTPNTPTNVNVNIASLEPAAALIQWDGMTGAYRYYIHSGFCDNNCSEPTFWDTYTSLYNAPTQMNLNLDKGAGKYFYKLTACGQTSNCSASSAVQTISFTGPDAPINLAVNLVDPNTPTYKLLWDASADASNYIIEQASCSDRSCSGISDSDWSQIGSSTTTEYTLPQVSSNFYAYSITACHSICGERSLPLNVDYTKPDIPRNLAINVVDESTRSYNLTWNIVEGIAEYKVLWAVCGNDCSEVDSGAWQLANGSITTNSWAFTVQENEYRTFRVAACRANGLCSDFSFAIDMPRSARAIRFIHSDNLGSPVAETDINQQQQ